MKMYNGKEVFNGLLFIKSMTSMENVAKQAVSLSETAAKVGID